MPKQMFTSMTPEEFKARIVDVIDAYTEGAVTGVELMVFTGQQIHLFDSEWKEGERFVMSHVSTKAPRVKS